MEWISVKDELPKVSKNYVGRCVLTWSPNFGYKTAVYSHDEGFDDYGYQADEITHWMELPEPPEYTINDAMNQGQ